MPLFIVRNDITRMRVDAIVNAANPSLLGGGGVDGAIHRAAGPGLLAECRALGGCETGEAKVTHAYDLPAKYVIHTVGPVWHGGDVGEPELLASCYRNSLAIAEGLRCESIAFPMISAGVYGYPAEEAFRIAENTVREHLENSEMTVYLVVFDRSSFTIGSTVYDDVSTYVEATYAAGPGPSPELLEERRRQAYLMTGAQVFAEAEAPAPPAVYNAAPAPDTNESIRKRRAAERRRERLEKLKNKQKEKQRPKADADASELCRRDDADCAYAAPRPAAPASNRPAAQHAAPIRPAPVAPPKHSMGEAWDTSGDLTRMLRSLDESFSQMLLRKIDEKGMTDAECYKRANIDRKLFSKIRSDAAYRPSKPTAIAFAIALELPIEEVRDLLMKAGYALSRSSKFDVIIEYFIQNRRYDIYEINEMLFRFDQPLLG